MRHNNYQQGSINRMMLIIFSLVVLVIAANAAYYFWDKNQREMLSKIEESIPTEIIEEELMETEENATYNFRELSNLSFLLPCYLNASSSALMYFPEGHLRDFFASISDDESISDLDCDNYLHPDANNYLMSLLQTDNDGDGLNLYLENINLTSDDIIDSDRDSYDDMTEVISGHDPNDFIEGNNSLADYYDYEVGEGGLVNAEEGENSEEEENTEEEEDEETSNPDEEEEEVVFESPEECLTLEGDDVDVCLNNFAIQERTLAICEMSLDFNNCVSINRDAFSALENIQECYDYVDLLTVSNYDQCLALQSVAKDSVASCFDVKDISVVSCINQVVIDNNNASHCANMYFLQTSVNNNNGFEDQMSCIAQIHDAEPAIEEVALLGCQQMLVEEFEEGYVVLQMQCFVNLAITYDNPEYCDMAAMVTGSFVQQFSDDCLNQL